MLPLPLLKSLTSLPRLPPPTICCVAIHIYLNFLFQILSKFKPQKHSAIMKYCIYCVCVEVLIVYILKSPSDFCTGKLILNLISLQDLKLTFPVDNSLLTCYKDRESCVRNDLPTEVARFMRKIHH